MFPLEYMGKGTGATVVDLTSIVLLCHYNWNRASVMSSKEIVPGVRNGTTSGV